MTRKYFKIPGLSASGLSLIPGDLGVLIYSQREKHHISSAFNKDAK